MFNKFTNRKKSGTERVRAARKRAKKSGISGINFKGISVLTICAAILIAGLFFAFKSLANFISSGKKEEQTVSELLQRRVIVEETDISGMTRQEAKSAIENAYPWSMKVHLGEDRGRSMDISNILDIKLDKILDSVYSDNSPESRYKITFEDMDNEISSEIKRIQENFDIPVKNGSISGFNKDDKTFIYEAEETGYLIDDVKLKEDLVNALDKKDFSADISAVQIEVKPAVTLEQAKAEYKVIGTFTTKTTNNADRNTNISLACEALDGIIIKPGEEFSFNNTTGNRTLERGYRAAGAYVNGVLVEEPGGGVCQVSSTLYNAVIFSGLMTTERHAHSFEPSYVTPGEDAMVSYDGYAGPDMKFVNTSDTAIALRAMLVGQTLTCSVIGIPILEEGVSVEMKSAKIKDLDPPAPEYIEDNSIGAGREVIMTEAKGGSKWVTNYIIKKDGEVIEDKEFHNSTYRGKPAKIRRNSSAKAVPKASETGTESSEEIISSSQSDENSEEESSAAQSSATHRRNTSSSSSETSIAEKTSEDRDTRTHESEPTVESINPTTGEIQNTTVEDTVPALPD